MILPVAIYLIYWQSCSSHSPLHSQDSKGQSAARKSTTEERPRVVSTDKERTPLAGMDPWRLGWRGVATFQVDFNWKRKGKGTRKHICQSPISVPSVSPAQHCFIWPQWWYLFRSEQLSCIGNALACTWSLSIP